MIFPKKRTLGLGITFNQTSLTGQLSNLESEPTQQNHQFSRDYEKTDFSSCFLGPETYKETDSPDPVTLHPAWGPWAFSPSGGLKPRPLVPVPGPD